MKVVLQKDHHLETKRQWSIEADLLSYSIFWSRSWSCRPHMIQIAGILRLSSFHLFDHYCCPGLSTNCLAQASKNIKHFHKQIHYM